MELQYHVSERDYIRHLEARKKERLRQPLNIFFTVVTALIPLSIFAFCWIQNLFTGWSLAALGLATLALSAANLTIRLGCWKRSDAELAVMKKTGKVSEDFWREHHLSVSEEGVSLKSGGYSVQYDWASFGGFERRADLLLPIFNAQPMDLIPEEALKKWGGPESFQEAFTDLAKQGIRAGQAEARSRVQGSPLLCYAYTKDAYVRDQRDAQRRRYTTRLIWNRAVLAKLLLSGVMIYAICTSVNLWLCLVYALILLMLNYEHLRSFSPLLARQLNRQLRPVLALKPQRQTELFLSEDSLVVKGDLHFLELPLSEILALRRLPHGAALYLTSQTILTVPEEAESFDTFYRRMETSLRNRRR